MEDAAGSKGENKGQIRAQIVSQLYIAMRKVA